MRIFRGGRMSLKLKTIRQLDYRLSISEILDAFLFIKIISDSL